VITISIIATALLSYGILFLDIFSIAASAVFWTTKEKKDAISATFYAILLTLIIIFSFTAPDWISIPTLPLVIWNAVDCYNYVDKNDFKSSIVSFILTLLFATVLVVF